MHATYLIDFDAAPELAAKTDIRTIEICGEQTSVHLLYQHIPIYARGLVRRLDGGTFHECEFSKEFANDLRARDLRLRNATVTATCTPEVADWLDPTGALRQAGLLTAGK